MNLLQMNQWIRRQARETSTVTITDAEIVLYLNEAYEDVAARTACIRRDIETVLGAGTEEIELPSYVTGVIRANIKNDNPLLSARVADLESILGVGWRTDSGTIQYLVSLGPTTFRVVPKPAGTTILEFFSAIIPSAAGGSNPVTHLAVNADEPKMPGAYHVALPYFAMREISTRDATNPEMQRRSAEYAGLYSASLEALKQSTATLEGGVITLPIMRPAAPTGGGG